MALTLTGRILWEHAFGAVRPTRNGIPTAASIKSATSREEIDHQLAGQQAEYGQNNAVERGGRHLLSEPGAGRHGKGPGRRVWAAGAMQGTAWLL